jgi:hypothetical protein
MATDEPAQLPPRLNESLIKPGAVQAVAWAASLRSEVVAISRRAGDDVRLAVREGVTGPPQTWWPIVINVKVGNLWR